MHIILPFLTGALMLVPAWLYFVVILYFCCITIPNMFGGYKTQNDMIFSIMMPVTKKDIIKSKVAVIGAMLFAGGAECMGIKNSIVLVPLFGLFLHKKVSKLVWFGVGIGCVIMFLAVIITQIKTKDKDNISF